MQSHSRLLVPIILLLSLFLSGCSPSGSEDRLHEGTLSFEDRERTYLLYRPEALPAGAPLVMVLHGFTGNARDIMAYTGMNAIAAREGFVVVYPQGSEDHEGRTFWQVGYDFHAQLERDDVGFLLALSRQLQQTHGFSPEQTFLTGMSNGGDMSFLMACQHPEAFRAIAPVAGVMMSAYLEACRPALPLMAIFGTADSTSLYAGDRENRDGWGGI